MWPHRWLTPTNLRVRPARARRGRDHDALSPSATPTPTSRQPARPGPRVTAIRPTSAGLAPAFSKARSRRPGRRSRWSRAASSGTTPPKSLCRSTCEWMTFDTTRRPSSTRATEVSSHDVSMPSVSASLFLPTQHTHCAGIPVSILPSPPASRGSSPRGGEPRGGELGKQVPSQAFDLGVDPLQVGLVRAPESGRMDGVGPHHDRVLSVVGVVALATADHLEAESLVHVHRVLVGRAHFEGHPFGAHVVGRLDETGEEDAAEALMMKFAADTNGRHVRLVVHAPHSAVTDDRGVELGCLVPGGPGDTLLAQHDIVRARARRQLAEVSVARPWRGEDLFLDLLHGRDVRFAHELQRQLLANLNHHFGRTEMDCMYSSLRLP